MRLTPLDIQNHRFNTRLRGYDPAEVEAFVRLIAEDVEALVRERDALRQQVRALETRVDELSVNEKTLKDTLVTAQALSEDLKKTAVKEAEVLISEAEVKSEKILDGTQRRAARLAEDIREMRMLRARLAGAIRGTIETHLELLEGLAKEEDETEMLLEARFSELTARRQAARQGTEEPDAEEPPGPSPLADR